MRVTHCPAPMLWLAAALALATATACSPEPVQGPVQELHVLNWEDYLAPNTLDDFQREYGIPVSLTTFGSEEQMLAMVQSRPRSYDVVVASDSMVSTMIELKLLAGLNKQGIPNLTSMEGSFLDPPYDPEGQYSVPYLWRTTGLAINTASVPASTKSWSVLWEPAYAGRLAMLSEPQEALRAALKLLGHPLNSRDPRHLAEAHEKLLQQRPLLAGYFDPMTIVQGLVREELWAAQLYSGDALSAAQRNPNLVYVLPSEGGAFWVDNLVIPVGTPHKAAAQVFVDYLLRPRVNASIADHLRYATPNKAAREFVRPELLRHPAIYPDQKALGRTEIYQPLGEGALQKMNLIWAKLQGQ